MNDTAPVYPCLLADIGGTNIRFALALAADQEPVALHTIPTARHPDFAEAARAWIDQLPAPWNEQRFRPVAASVAVACPPVGERIRLTNSDFVIDRTQTTHDLGLHTLLIVNDFEAQAWALPVLQADDLVALGSRTPSRDQTMAVLGPGTGLGCAGLLRNASGWHAISGEGGHVTLAPMTADEADVLAAARRRHGHVSAERLVAGIGLPSLYLAVADVAGSPLPTPPTPEQITRTALDRSDPLAVRTLEHFCAFLGGLAGNCALTFGAFGGVFIAGGIAPRIAPFLQQSAFRDRFESKGRFAGYLQKIGTAMVVRKEPALAGLQYAITQRGARH